MWIPLAKYSKAPGNGRTPQLNQSWDLLDAYEKLTMRISPFKSAMPKVLVGSRGKLGSSAQTLDPAILSPKEFLKNFKELSLKQPSEIAKSKKMQS